MHRGLCIILRAASGGIRCGSRKDCERIASEIEGRPSGGRFCSRAKQANQTLQYSISIRFSVHLSSSGIQEPGTRRVTEAEAASEATHSQHKLFSNAKKRAHRVVPVVPWQPVRLFTGQKNRPVDGRRVSAPGGRAATERNPSRKIDG